jgi:glycosyltransferase involved in cell wall biosynthesis
MNNISKDNNLLVSVCMITYNHEEFISQAIEGILMQNCNFQVELLIGEDYSTDYTRQICQEYASKYSNINLLPSETNLGMIPNFRRTLSACNGKYIALCEGDDYWTDPYKLQKQVDFLESHPDYTMLHTNKAVLFNNKLHTDNSLVIKSGYIFEELMFVPLISTLTVLCRADFLKDSLARVSLLIESRNWLMGDFPLWLDIAQNHQIAYLNKVTGVYRFLDESVSHSKNNDKSYRFEHSVIDVKEYYYKIYTNAAKKVSYRFKLRFSEMIFHAKKRLVLDHGWKAKNEIKSILFTNPILYGFFLFNKASRLLNLK